MVHVLSAAIMTASLWLSLQGVVMGTYVIITILILNVMLVTFYASIALGVNVSNVVVDMQEAASKKREQNLSAMILVRLAFFAAAWHIFTLGYIILAGAAFVTITINTLALVVSGINKLIEKNK